MAGMLSQFFGQMRDKMGDCLGKRLVLVGAPDKVVRFVIEKRAD
jgi:hypothetical protein